jgi:hypothetical protein
MQFLDVQGDGRVSVFELKYLLPAICFSSDGSSLGRDGELSANDVLVRIALFCSYTNYAPPRLCANHDLAHTGFLSYKSLVLLIKAAIKGTLWHTFFQAHFSVALRLSAPAAMRRSMTLPLCIFRRLHCRSLACASHGLCTPSNGASGIRSEWRWKCQCGRALHRATPDSTQVGEGKSQPCEG